MNSLGLHLKTFFLQISAWARTVWALFSKTSTSENPMKILKIIITLLKQYIEPCNLIATKYKPHLIMRTRVNFVSLRLLSRLETMEIQVVVDRTIKIASLQLNSCSKQEALRADSLSSKSLRAEEVESRGLLQQEWVRKEVLCRLEKIVVEQKIRLIKSPLEIKIEMSSSSLEVLVEGLLPNNLKINSGRIF